MTLRRYEHAYGPTRDEVRAEVARRYTAGETVRSIATDLGRSYGFVHRLLVESRDVTLRSRGARPKPVDSEIPGQLALDETAESVA